MSFGTRYTRVEPPVGSNDYHLHSSPPPMEFVNSINPSQSPVASPYQTEPKMVNASYTEHPNQHSPPSSTDLPNYEPYGSQHASTRPSRPPRRRTTGNSLVTTLSSVWTTTRDHVSHFRIPKIAAPWEHEPVPEKGGFATQPPSNTARDFDHRKQRLRLFVNSSFRLLFTAFLCACLAAVLYGFSTVVTGMTDPMKKGFNALITGLSIIVGLNLSASLKGYANMMRWRFLAAGYRRLQDFELVMQCESQQAVFRLLWAGRTRGRLWPNKTQILVFIWLTINVALQTVTALLGLTYSIDISEKFVLLTNGNITIADLSSFYLSTTQDYSISGQGSVAQNYGVNGQDYPVYNSTFGAYEGQQQAMYSDEAGDRYWYTWIDQDPEGKQTVVSTRQIMTNATCRDFKVTKGGQAGWDNPGDPDNVTIIRADGTEATFYVAPQTAGGTTWSIVPSNDPAAGARCGPRCAILYALQVADNDTVAEPRFWECRNTVSHVTGISDYGSASVFDMPDLQAWIAAGAIAFSGSTTMFDGDLYGTQYMMYPAESFWSPPGEVTAHDMAGKVMMYTAGAFAAMDVGKSQRLTIEPRSAQQPEPAQVVHVNWKWACIVLGVIPAVQAIILVVVIGWANKAVIRDEGHLATARLLAPIVNKLGDRGSALTSDEIAEELGNYRVSYAPRFPAGTVDGAEASVTKRLAVVSEHEGVDRWHGRMPAGKYD